MERYVYEYESHEYVGSAEYETLEGALEKATRDHELGLANPLRILKDGQVVLGQEQIVAEVVNRYD